MGKDVKDDGFGAGQWAAAGAAAVALLCAGASGFYLSGQETKAKAQDAAAKTRSVEVPKGAGRREDTEGDLELQNPLLPGPGSLTARAMATPQLATTTYTSIPQYASIPQYSLQAPMIQGVVT